MLESLAGGLGSLRCGGLAAAELGRLVGEDLLGVVDLLAFERFETRDLVEGQLGEELQEPADRNNFV